MQPISEVFDRLALQYDQDEQRIFTVFGQQCFLHPRKDRSLKNQQSISLVVADVDGTLLNSRHELTEKTRAALLALRREGIKFTLATGKILPAVSGLCAQLEINEPLILSNGALVQKPCGMIIHQAPIPSECLDPLISTINAHQLDYALYTPTTIYVTRNTFNTLLVVEYGDPFPVEQEQIASNQKSYCKLLVLDRQDPAKLEFMEKLLNDRFGDEIKAKRSVPGMLEVFNVETSKAYGLQKTADFLSISLSNTLVFGDSYNDIDMFKVAGMAVAMGNAPDSIKNQAHAVAGTNDEDGIASCLRQLFPQLR